MVVSPNPNPAPNCGGCVDGLKCGLNAVSSVYVVEFAVAVVVAMVVVVEWEVVVLECGAGLEVLNNPS